MTDHRTFSLQSAFLLTASVAILLGLAYQGRQLSEQSRQIATFHKHVERERPNAPQEPDTFDYHWELLANTADLKLYLFTVRSGDPHELLFGLNDTVTIVDSYYDPDERTNKSRATVCIDWVADDRIKITLANPQATGRSDFASKKSLHIFQFVNDKFDYDRIVYPEFSTMGLGASGYYSWNTEPQELFHWNGDERASLSVRFKTRTLDRRVLEDNDEDAGTKHCTEAADGAFLHG